MNVYKAHYKVLLYLLSNIPTLEMACEPTIFICLSLSSHTEDSPAVATGEQIQSNVVGKTWSVTLSSGSATQFVQSFDLIIYLPEICYVLRLHCFPRTYKLLLIISTPCKPFVDTPGNRARLFWITIRGCFYPESRSRIVLLIRKQPLPLYNSIRTDFDT